MNEDIMKGKWNQLRGELQKQWGKLTNDDIDQINGDALKLEGRLQERYGLSKERAHAEADRFLKTRSHEDTDFSDEDMPPGNTSRGDVL